ncbi:protein PEROXIN-4-like isoform 2 [Planoprotostelium fungivorum]|uniref:E2 ubiquitin-conjugating enzyme n=1 Tax=Planoprotostelium fungivorum TaxID=1890364 RepID=A0A2P6MQ50_9EUKA|nr:protein PEROXIN-4-like isoform 2 [Planoprotostelium fungivorum]
MQAQRLLKEYKGIKSEPSEDISLAPVDDDDLLHWSALIRGPVGTPFEAGVFKLAITIPTQYPLEPPKVRFITKVFHPNIHFKSGEICLDLLKNAWSAIYTLQSVCRAIASLLASPEPDSPLNCDCGNLLRSGDVRGYNSMVRMYTKLYAQIPFQTM